MKKCKVSAWPLGFGRGGEGNMALDVDRYTRSVLVSRRVLMLLRYNVGCENLQVNSLLIGRRVNIVSES